MIWTLVGLLLVLLGIVGVVILIGLLLPVGHVAASRIEIPAPRSGVWATLLDAERHPEWRTDLKRVEVRREADGMETWIEHNRHGRLTMALEIVEEPAKLVTRIADDALPFGGSWTYELAERDGGTTEVRITERGEVYNPIFRFMSRLVMGHHGTMDGYLRNLCRKFGGAAEPAHEPIGG